MSGHVEQNQTLIKNYVKLDGRVGLYDLKDKYKEIGEKLDEYCDEYKKTVESCMFTYLKGSKHYEYDEQLEVFRYLSKFDSKSIQLIHSLVNIYNIDIMKTEELVEELIPLMHLCDEMEVHIYLPDFVKNIFI